MLFPLHAVLRGTGKLPLGLRNGRVSMRAGSRRIRPSRKYDPSIRDQILAAPTWNGARAILAGAEAAVRAGTNHASTGTRAKWFRAAEAVERRTRWEASR
jgi:hypothetical protein